MTKKLACALAAAVLCNTAAASLTRVTAANIGPGGRSMSRCPACPATNSRRGRETLADLRIVVMSGNDLGGKGYAVVRKPFSQPQLEKSSVARNSPWLVHE